ncbi:hypothetical protein [Fontibacillus sp. BL9]|uniref:hypothetical protein n=1 Tax=Fontibacillus sp. BL9 TaxID=3389971 RepID=UPI003978A5D1
MGQEEINGVKEFLPLAEKYGLAVVLTFILLVILAVLVKMIIKGDLVPRSLLDKAEDDRDRLQAILDKEREGFMAPLLEMVKNLKKDEDRGG